MIFQYEADFEEALISTLSENGWEKEVLCHPTERDLIQNWAKILFDNNRGIDRLNNYPLTDGEMHQILEQITALRTPLKLNGFINGKTVSITRDNPEDKLHFGKEISLKIYDRKEIAAGQSRYQIVQQPEFAGKSTILGKRRGDLMLLINGMPVIHIELKRSGVPVSEAYFQIEKYAHEGIFTGLFSLVQIFVAMNPEETLYFANPGPDGSFNSDYYFHWANFNNVPMNNWKEIASSLLSIPKAHELIGFYTVADGSDGILKVMRSYQYYAASAISDVVAKTHWDSGNQLGGYVWHTTGSGKTMTSFKSAQLIANSRDADKVVFLTDRIELGTQSLNQYRSFAEESEEVQGTENTWTLISKLKSKASRDTLIVTSIQKMSNIKNGEDGVSAHDIEVINRKRIVFIIDEAHRSTFGDMLITIKQTFPRAVFFGFTGTPIYDENRKKLNTTATIFGNELHRYSIIDGLRDRNVLGFDPYMVLTYRDRDVRRAVALERAKAKNEQEARKDPKREEIFNRFMNSSETRMAGYRGDNGAWVKGIEDYVPLSQYRTRAHKNHVVEDVMENWSHFSHDGKFHGIFATGSIPEAIDYYRIFKKKMPKLKVTCLVDPNIDNHGDAVQKEDGLKEIMLDYNKRYGMEFKMATYARFKKDIAQRLAHKEPYQRLERTPEKQLDLLIVVDQMLTGFDSKWVNTLYLDKMLEYENIIQAFSRTNRLFGPEKPFGVIRYYRKPHTMKYRIQEAIKLYSGEKPIGLFVAKLPENLRKMDEAYREIAELFRSAGIPDFVKLPEQKMEKAKFASLFKTLYEYMEAAKIQGFLWSKLPYVYKDETSGYSYEQRLSFDENTYRILLKRYQELEMPGGGGAGGDVPYELENHLTEIDTGVINAEFMNSRFEKYLKALKFAGSTEEEIKQALDELHKTFAVLNQEEQKYANLFLHDVERGSVLVKEGYTLRDYITEYQCKAKNDEIHRFAETFGMSEEKLRSFMRSRVTETNLNEFGRYDELRGTVDKEKARVYFEKKNGKPMDIPGANMEMNRLLRMFILKGGFEI